MSFNNLAKRLVAWTLFISSVCGTAVAMADASDSQQVAQKVEALRQAMIDGDGKALRNLSAPQLSYGHSSGVMEDQEAFIEKISSGKSDFVTIDLTNQTIRISGDTALVRHDLKADIKDGGVPNTIHLGILLVWQKQSGDWKLLARQAFKYPPQVTP
ncbi:nuclear transport factor 2 family protein [Cellvibrio sp. UBA7661]|uniref:nuclear transport factor 2 family protein n=1 Tax=Cellvibrio sp. UBA7661 TaxID=1946311 RepID=UPI002F351205